MWRRRRIQPERIACEFSNVALSVAELRTGIFERKLAVRNSTFCKLSKRRFAPLAKNFTPSVEKR